MNKSESIKNITPAIIKVMQAVKGMEKNSRVGKGQNAYDGTKDKDVKEAFNEALANNGLAILPIGIDETADVHRWEEKGQYGMKVKYSVFTKVITKYLLTHVSGEFIELTGYGHGHDQMDKSAGKATTYALKNCLLYTFLTPVGKIDDTDTTHSQDMRPIKKQAVQQAKKKAVTYQVRDMDQEIYKKWKGGKMYTHTDGKTKLIFVAKVGYRLSDEWISFIEQSDKFQK